MFLERFLTSFWRDTVHTVLLERDNVMWGQPPSWFLIGLYLINVAAYPKQ